jgi:hypothetical protein
MHVLLLSLATLSFSSEVRALETQIQLGLLGNVPTVKSGVYTAQATGSLLAARRLLLERFENRDPDGIQVQNLTHCNCRSCGNALCQVRYDDQVTLRPCNRCNRSSARIAQTVDEKVIRLPLLFITLAYPSPHAGEVIMR